MLCKRVLKNVLSCMVLVSVAGGCVSNPFDRTPRRPPPVQPIPSEPVQIDALPPLDENEIDGGYGRTVASANNNTNTARPVISTPAWRTMLGRWKAQDASGNCRINLTSSPTLDFYKAGTSGCQNQDLAKVSSWEYRNGEVYLYQSGGTVAARLKAGTQQMDGVLQSSGAAVTLTK